MTTALCLRCGACKLGAFRACETCGGSAGTEDRALAIALSTHVLAMPVLERLGQLIAELGARATDGAVRHAAFLVFLREHMPRPYHRDIAPAALEDAARALLAQVALPDVRIATSPSGSAPLPLPHASQPRALFWEQVMAEVRRNPTLSLVGEAPIADAPDLVILGDRAVVMHDAAVVVAPGDEAMIERRRARHVASQIETRRRDLEAIGAAVVRAQGVYLEGERPTPVHVAFDELAAALPELPRRRIAAHVAQATIEYAALVTREEAASVERRRETTRIALARLVERAPAEVAFRRATVKRSPASIHARR